MPTEIDPAGMMPRAVLEAAEFRNARVLEVGAGDGRLTFQYAAEPAFVAGIDTNEVEIRAATAAKRIGRAQFLCASAASLPFGAERFDIVLLASSL